VKPLLVETQGLQKQIKHWAGRIIALADDLKLLPLVGI